MRKKLLQTRAEVWGTPMDRYVLDNPVVEIENMLVDANAFFETRSSCESCSVSCNWGTTFPRETVAKLEPVMDEIRKKYIPEERWDSLGWHFSESYGMNYSNLVEIEPGRTACSFLYKKDQHYLCSIFSLAVEQRKDPFELWPFECTMYPIAIQPYKGLLYPENKSLLTLSLPQTLHLIDVYGDRPANRSFYAQWRKEFKLRLKAKLRRLRFRKPRTVNAPVLEPHFCTREGWVKPYSYQYYGRHLRWYFGDAFYEELCRHADAYYQSKRTEPDC